MEKTAGLEKGYTLTLCGRYVRLVDAGGCLRWQWVYTDAGIAEREFNLLLRDYWG
jgi:hypothetical protein